ncbi:uncharacterized protein LOC129717335 [Wyeomyia smithii]|uniref:uncharacterized protein LOC129717335 n=1 Tax=Wyeomyia smithii TaxID=174621 RepID=UPI002467F209|nr:uncharacterized protein LOC129717335 [Wyeomyia smithii]
MSIIDEHSPHLGRTDDDKEEFYAQLEREYDRYPEHDVKIVVGDNNAQVNQEEEFRSVFGRFSVHLLANENDLRPIDFAASKNMAIRSSFFQHCLQHRYTCRSPNQMETQIDHVLIDGRPISDMIDVKAHRGANIDSDRYLVMVKLRQKLPVGTVCYRCPPRYDFVRPKQPEVAGNYALSLEARRGRAGRGPSRGLLECRQVSHQQSSGERPRSRSTDEEYRQISDEKNAARAIMLRRATRLNVERYKQKRRQQTQLFQEKSAATRRSSAKSYNSCTAVTKHENSFRDSTYQGCRDKEGNILTYDREVIERWRQHYDEHLNSVQAGDQNSDAEDSVGVASNGDVPPPSISEVNDTIQRLKKNKAAGKDGIGAELLKMGPGKLASCLHRLIAKPLNGAQQQPWIYHELV